MLIIRGVNVFPSQIEAVLGREPQLAPHYVLEVRRPHTLDELEVLVEMRPELSGKLSAEENTALAQRGPAPDQGLCGHHCDGARARAGNDRALAGQGQASHRPAAQRLNVLRNFF